MPPKNNLTAAAKDYSTLTSEELIKELLASQHACAENLELAEIADDKSKGLSESLSAANERILSLENELSTLKRGDEKDEEISSLKEEISELKDQLIKEQQDNTQRNQQFESGGKTYEILVAKARIPGFDEALTALEIANDETAQEVLIKNNSGIISEIK